MWRAASSTPHRFSHTLMVRVVGDRCVIAQCYYGYYSIDTWLAFDKPLARLLTVPPPTQRNWHHALVAHPRFRGVLCADEQKQQTPAQGRESLGSGVALAQAIDRLARGANDGGGTSKMLRDYRDITGLNLVMQSPCLTQMGVTLVRLDLNARR